MIVRCILPIAVILLTTAACYGQALEVIDLGWRYNSTNIDGYVAIVNTGNDTIRVSSVRGSEDDVITYNPVKLLLPPHKSFIAAYSSKVLHRKFPNDSSVVCAYMTHSNKQAFSIPFKIGVESAGGTLEMREVPFTPQPGNLNNRSFCPEIDSVHTDEPGMLQTLDWISGLSSFHVSKSSVNGEYIYEGYLVFQFRSKHGMRPAALQLDAQLSGIKATKTNISHVFENTFGPDYVVVRIYLTARQLLKRGKEPEVKITLRSDAGTLFSRPVSATLSSSNQLYSNLLITQP